MARGSHRTLERWGILGAAAVVLAVEATLSLAGRSGFTDTDDGLRTLIRATARTSAAWFVLAFVARPLTVLGAGRPGKWLLRNRRYLGLAFAISHGGHLLAILALARHEGAAFWDKVAITTLVGGGFGYVVLAAMVATSYDGAQRALGRSRWRALHLTGMWTFWVIFTASYAPAFGTSAIAAVATAVLVAAAVVRGLAAKSGSSAR
jgi:ABC-type Na+ efflux pump permease subunit